MVNIDDFIKRLETILEYYSLNASSFADKIGVQRSSMSHLLSGRNKPSLEFILKIIDVFPEVDLYWIIKGSGVFPNYSESKENFKTDVENSATPAPIDLFSSIPSSLKKEIIDEKIKPAVSISENENSLEIEKIVFFYKNGTFKIYDSNL